MPIFRLEGDDISNAKLAIARKTNMELESHLESWIENSPPVLAQQPILWIGKQTSATVEDSTIFPDLLGIDSEGNLVIVELKRDKAPKEVVAQLLEYAAWANELSKEQIQKIAEDYFENRGEFKGKHFHDVFKDEFDMLETDEIPPLNQNLRLYIVAGNIPARVAGVCRFLRTSHGMDINCINVSVFETEARDRFVSMETTVGNEDIFDAKTKNRIIPQTSRWSDDKPVKQVVWEAVQELMKGDKEFFAPKEVKPLISEKYPKFNMNNLNAEIRADCVNNSTRHQYSANEDRYWWIERGKYHLYDPDKDKMEGDGRVNQTDSVTENPT